MFKHTLLAAIGLVAIAVVPAYAGCVLPNGVSLNGVSLNGLWQNGVSLNGIAAPDTGFTAVGLTLPDGAELSFR
jgi:hypothetical protein